MSDETLDLTDLTDEPEDDGFVDDGSMDAIDEHSPLASAEELASRVRRMVELRNARDETKIAADKAKAAFDRYQAEFFEEYQRSPLKGSIKVDLGGTHGTVQIVPRSTKFGRILDRDKAIAYFKERNQLDEFVKDDFRMARLNELVREHLEQKKPLPPGIDFRTTDYFTITFKD